ncbi:hypothetical protein LCGC14_1771700 [marine sediment metagenome]|uniref:FAD dependent oxidoreductase domain-containing protein n=1 Tax=marine sediment metagenome TaxID=412755 RepID=A0A0F9GY34_9ZZZZ
MRVAIIGGGLVGRLAAWATMQAGHTPIIFDRMPEAVTPRGFVYLHDNCGLPLTPQNIHVIETGGNRFGYAYKVYRDTFHEVSFGKYAGVHEGYDPAELLNILNGLQHGMVKDSNFNDIDEIMELRHDYAKLIITLSANLLFPDINLPSVKGSVGVYPLNAGEVLKNFCVYSADPNIPWYRSGSMFGYAFREFSTVIPGHRTIVKVVLGDEVPQGKDTLHTGRFGKWTKQLSHESYEEVLKWLS